MALSLLEEFVILVVKNPCHQQEESSPNQVISISASEFESWDFSEILSYGNVKVRAHRARQVSIYYFLIPNLDLYRLIQESSYFHGLLSGSFSESGLDHISIEWNQEMFLNLLMYLYGYTIDITSSSLLPLLEAALYFGVERLLSKCKSWLSVLALSNDPALPKLELSDLIQIWSFGLEHAGELVTDLCEAYLAKNFMLIKSDKYFGNVPYELLMCCIKHPHLTVHSESHLADALLVWLEADRRMSDLSESSQDNTINLMQQIRFSLLPLWFIAGRSKSHGFSKFADQNIELVLKLMKMSSTCLVDSLTDGPPADLRVRLTEYTEILDLSGCLQLNEAILLLSVLPNSFFANLMWRKRLKIFLKNHEDNERNEEQLSQRILSILSFETVKEVDISKCQRLDYKVAIKCFSKSFPSLRKLGAAYLLNISVSTILKLLQNFRQLNEVDLRVDIAPVLPGQASVICSSPGRCSRSNITRLTLEGRNDICDIDLWNISRLCDSLCYLNIKRCALLTDPCIAYVIQRCKKLHSLIVCYTSFSGYSILALCTTISVTNEQTDSNSAASNLQMLHMSKCEGVDETSLLNLITRTQKMKSLCLRDTKISDSVLYEFCGSSLEALDISNTMISRMALAHVISKNPDLKSLKARGCKNLLQLQSGGRTDKFSPLVSGQELFKCLGKRSGLEDLDIGWGFSYFSLVSLRPAVSFLRAISLGLGASLGEDGLKLLSSASPLLESIVLCFQEITDSALTSIVTSLKHLQELALSYCFGDISLQSLKLPMLNLRKLRLERVTPWMTNDDLLVLTQSYPNLTELSLVGCSHLNSDAQPIISTRWPGMIYLHLEECGRITENGVASLYSCIALEDLLLCHNGSGIQKSFLLDAALKFPMLRLISLDTCDAKEGDFDVPEEKEEGRFLSIVKISRCKSKRCTMGIGSAPVHKETLVMFWNGQNFTKTLLKQRL
ncbi:BTB/POZ domain-containing protein FBL11 [Cardamine amara subsp. amara]|uniref:BTB/POZ domain-containing protein FBL11 n=1 Tax=Cardamine amara subsp. amara TaxID=228776 RepID=A0ABD1C4E3_CARAN